MKKHQPLFYLLSAFFSLILFVNMGCNKGSDSSAVIPSLITYNLIANVTTNSAQAYGLVADYGGSGLTEEGICWSATNQNPTINDSKITNNVDTGVYARNLTGLTANTTYYVRAYATNSAGTGYGNVIKFKTNTATFAITATVSTFAGNGASGLVNGPASSSQFFNPQGICIDAQGSVYVADTYNNVIRKITAGISTTFAGSGTVGYVDGPSANAAFYAPKGLAIDAAGNLYVADMGNNIIRKVSLSGVVTTLAGKGNPGYNDGTSTNAMFNAPAGIAVDAQGIVYVADKGNNAIRKITAAGVVTTLAGSPAKGQLDATTGTSALFNAPTGITLDASGNVYVADQGNYAIRIVTQAGVVSTLMGNVYLKTVFGVPVSITAGPAGNMFVTDANGRILEISSAGILYSLAGASGAAGFANGTNADAIFNSPQAIASDAQGNLYVTDYYNNMIRKITLATQQ